MKQKRLLAIVLVVALTVAAVGCTQQTPKEPETTAPATTPTKAPAEEPQTMPSEFRMMVVMLGNVQDFKIPFWGGYSLEDKQVVIFSDAEDNAVAWNVDGKSKIEVIKKADIPAENTKANASTGDFNGKQTIFVKHQEKDIDAFAEAMKTGYQAFGQSWLKDIEFKPLTDATSPANVEARYLMNEVDSRLRAKIEGKNEDGASEALYFFNQYKKDQAADYEESLKALLTEGTATYVTNLYIVVSGNPNLKGDIKEASTAAYQQNKKELEGTVRSKEEETSHAPIYFYLATTADEAVVNEIAKGVNPYDLLAKVTEPKEAEGDSKLKEEVTAFYQKADKE